MNNIKLIQQAISYSNIIQCNLNKYILKEGQPIIIDQCEWLREVLSLLAKQSNLFEGCFYLLENNMEQEAYILVRSQFNNMLWISYICNDDNNKRVKEYYNEFYITQFQQLLNIEKYLSELPKNNQDLKQFYNLDIKTLHSRINQIYLILKEAGYEVLNLNKPPRNKKIIDLADKDPLLLGMYNTLYNDASKFEHSNISIVKNYRTQIVNDVSTDVAFIFDLSKSNIKLWKTVYNNTLKILFQSINKLFYRLRSVDKFLFTNKLFDEFDFQNLILLIKDTVDIVDLISDDIVI